MGRWRPLLRQHDDFMSDAASQSTAGSTGTSVFSAPCDIQETSEQYLLSFDMPGIDEKDIDIQLHGNQLVVSGERRFERDEAEGKSHVVERRYGRFERSVTLPEGIKADQVDARYDAGVLKVTIPKPAEAKPTRIKIGAKEQGRKAEAAQKS
jgi:HSP20 family protein